MPANRDGSVTGLPHLRSAVQLTNPPTRPRTEFVFGWQYINYWTVCRETAIVTLSVKDKVKVRPSHIQPERRVRNWSWFLGSHRGVINPAVDCPAVIFLAACDPIYSHITSMLIRQYRITPLGDRNTCVNNLPAVVNYTTAKHSGVKPAISLSPVQRPLIRHATHGLWSSASRDANWGGGWISEEKNVRGDCRVRNVRKAVRGKCSAKKWPGLIIRWGEFKTENCPGEEWPG